VRKAEGNVIAVAIQITKISSKRVKGNSPFDSASGKGRQILLQKMVCGNQKFANFGRICFFDVI